MNLSINGQSQVPPGFRFHPTEEELLQYYLRKKVAYEKIDLDVIREVDLNKLEPWDIQEKCRIGSTPQNDWYFFSHKDKKYPTGTRTNRATAAGFWKATGRDKIIYSGFRRIGLRKTLVFYKGRAPHGQKSDWIMHEYRLDESTQEQPNVQALTQSGTGDLIPEEGWVVCRVFKKKNYQKTLDSPKGISTNNSMDNKIQGVGSDTIHDGVLDQILSYMGRACKDESGASSLGVALHKLNYAGQLVNSNLAMHVPMNERFLHLPRLESPPTIINNNTTPMNNANDQNSDSFKQFHEVFDEIETGTGTEAKALGGHEEDEELQRTTGCGGVNDWVALDRLVASQLNGQVETETSKQLSSCFNDMSSVSLVGLTRDDDDEDNTQVQAQLSTQIRLIRPNHTLHIFANNDNDLWSFTPNSSSSSSDPLRHLSV